MRVNKQIKKFTGDNRENRGRRRRGGRGELAEYCLEESDLFLMRNWEDSDNDPRVGCYEMILLGRSEKQMKIRRKELVPIF